MFPLDVQIKKFHPVVIYYLHPADALFDANLSKDNPNLASSTDEQSIRIFKTYSLGYSIFMNVNEAHL